MSYWSLRRAAERAAAGHELARSADGRHAPAPAKRPVQDWTPVDRHPANVSSPARTLRQRAGDLERALWTVPSPDPADVDPNHPGLIRPRPRSRW